MADTSEKILLEIEIVKGQNEKEIDALTRKITELQQATASLQKQNNELIKTGQQNSQEFVENTRQIEINKQKINEAASSRKGLVQTLISEEKSIKALNIENAELRKKRDSLTTATAEGRAEIARLNALIEKNTATILDNSTAQEKQRANIGNYKSALDGLVPGFSGMVDGLNKAKAAAIAFIATPLGAVLGAIGLAISAVTAYFKGSEEGQNKWNKVVAIGSAILEQFVNVLEDVGGAIVSAFENPKQAAIDLMNFLQDQFVNRITGILTLIPKLASAVEQLFQGNFAEAGKIAVDAVGQVVLGVENATDVIKGFIDETTALVEQGIKNGELIAALNAQIDRDERALIVDRQKLNLEVQKLREKALQEEGDKRKQILLEAIALEEQLAAREVNLAKERAALAEAELKANGDDKEALKAVAEARAEVFAAEATQFQNTLRFRKEIAAIDEAAAKEQAALLAEANKMLDDAEKLELDRQQRIREALIETEQLRLEQAVTNAASIEERINREIELEQFKAFTLLENEKLLEEERQLIIEKSQAAINAIIVKGTQERIKKEQAEEKKLADEKKRLRDAETSGREAAADAAVGFARAAFGHTKAVAVAEATINTIGGVVRALKDYIFPYSLIVGALVGAAGAINISKILSTKAARGMLVRKIARTGGMLRGPSHRNGGIPFTVAGQGGFEAEGGEAIINKKSTQMFRPLLSKINQAGGGVPFGKGGVTFQSGGTFAATQQRQAFQASESRSAIRDSVQAVMENMPPIFVSVVDINERSNEVSDQASKANVI